MSQNSKKATGKRDAAAAVGVSSSTTPAMPQIETIVYIMFENRSMDYVLGWLYLNGLVIDNPNVVFPEGSSPQFNGFISPLPFTTPSNVANGVTYWVATGTDPGERVQGHANAFAEPMRSPRADPNESFDYATRQLYADGNGNMPADPWPNLPTMTGFAYDYALNASYVAPQEIMGAYTPAQLPVLNGLAKNFAVSDRWFSSVPSQTDCNRAFSICGTSLGGVDNGTPKVYDTPTLFNAIGTNKTWSIYWQFNSDSRYAPIVSGDPGGNAPCYTGNIFPQIQNAVSAGQGTFEFYDTFVQQAAAGTLPNFCYLEPYWGGGKADEANMHNYWGLQGNDCHPNAWMGPSEAYINSLYNLLTKQAPQWPNMLFIITFDEHGGTYDHEPPTSTIAPDGNTQNGFDSSRLGVRVPTILISPYIQPGTVFRAPSGSKYDFDHTSMIATILKWAGVDPTSAGLGLRVAAAPTFEDVLSSTPSGVTPPVFTTPSLPNRPGYAHEGGGVGTSSPRVLGHHRDKNAATSMVEPGDAMPPDSLAVELEALMSTTDVADQRRAWHKSKSIQEFIAQLKALTSPT